MTGTISSVVAGTAKEEMFAERVRALVADRFGYSPRPAAMTFLCAVLQQRRAGCSFDEYWERLIASRSPEDELQQLVEDILVHETGCGRTPPHFEALRRWVLPELGATGQPIRMASLGCSTGEETYTLALSAGETLGFDYPIEIVGLDLSRRALRVAREGTYPAFNLRELAPDERSRGFVRVGDDYKVRPEVARMVRFAPHNLLDPLPFVCVDAVFCRNVLIYFGSTAAARVLRHIRDALSPGGWLFVGHSESALHQRDWFEPVSYPETLAYRRRKS